MTSSRLENSIPVLLLKTQSTPKDIYEVQFSKVKEGIVFEPIFVPVLEVQHRESGLNLVQKLLRNDRFGRHEFAKYGGLIFTSQRAAEVFRKVVARLVEEGDGAQLLTSYPASIDNVSSGNGHFPHLEEIPIYSVGPATSRVLRSIQQTTLNLQIFGDESGNGEALADYILDHYGDFYRDSDEKRPLLFLVGEERRDIIPKTLMNPPRGYNCIGVEELVVYETGKRDSFEKDFTSVLEKTGYKHSRWAVLFSPAVEPITSMFRALNMLDPSTGKVSVAAQSTEQRSTYIATIGSTTSDFLKQKFDFKPDICAESPTPESVEAGIRRFIKNARH
jgi:uroporphyrinogen-III synthase